MNVWNLKITKAALWSWNLRERVTAEHVMIVSCEHDEDRKHGDKLRLTSMSLLWDVGCSRRRRERCGGRVLTRRATTGSYSAAGLLLSSAPKILSYFSTHVLIILSSAAVEIKSIHFWFLLNDSLFFTLLCWYYKTSITFKQQWWNVTKYIYSGTESTWFLQLLVTL